MDLPPEMPLDPHDGCTMTDITKHVQAFKHATRNLRDKQEDLRLARAEYNKARDALTDDGES